MHPLHLWLALNDGTEDGRDVSWIWDVTSSASAGRLPPSCAAAGAPTQLALRIKCAEWDCRISVDPDLDASFERALRGAPDMLIALPTYSALLGLRPVLNRHGVSVTDWGLTAHGI